MKSVVRVKLTPTPAQEAALAATLTACNEAATYVASVAFDMRDKQGRTPNKFVLQDALYNDIKARFGLSAQPALRVIKKTVDANKTFRANLLAGNYGKVGSARRTKVEAKPVTFRANAAQPFDDRCLSWDHKTRTVSIWTTTGRMKNVPFVGRDSDLELLAKHRQGESDLVNVDGKWYLIATLDLPDVPVSPPKGFVGVDLGIVNIATAVTDAGVQVGNWSGGAVTARRKKNQKLRTRLQSKGTTSAKRLLVKRNKKEVRFVTDTNHVVSKRIMVEAQRTGHGVAIEDLGGIRERARLRKPQRTMLHSWAFAQLGQFLTYKAHRYGVALVVVDPAYTSQMCSKCEHVERKNRPSRDVFKCVSCNWSLPADTNAAINIARVGVVSWAAVNQPYAA